MGETKEHVSKVRALKANKVMWVFIRLFPNSSQDYKQLFLASNPGKEITINHKYVPMEFEVEFKSERAAKNKAYCCFSLYDVNVKCNIFLVAGHNIKFYTVSLLFPCQYC